MSGSVVTYGYGTQAFYQVIATLTPTLAIAIFLTVRPLGLYAEIKEHLRQDQQISKQTRLLAFSAKLVDVSLAVLLLILLIAVPVSITVEFTDLLVLANGEASQTEFRVVFLGIFVLLFSTAISAFLWATNRLLSSTTKRSPTSQVDQE